MRSHDWVRRNFWVHDHAAERWLQRIHDNEGPYTERQLDRAKFAVLKHFTDAVNGLPPVRAGDLRYIFGTSSELRFVVDKTERCIITVLTATEPHDEFTARYCH